MTEYSFYPFKYKGGVQKVNELDSRQLMFAVGGNVGNLAFQYPMELLFDCELKPWTEAIERHFLIVTGANWIEDKEKAPFNELLFSKISEYDHVLLYGLGAQARLGTTPHEYSADLPASLTARLYATAEKLNSIAVRDEFTAQVLKSLGVENVHVLGCSSIFMNASPNIGAQVISKAIVALNCSEQSIKVTLNEFTHNAKSRSLTSRDLNANICFLKTRYSHYLLQGRHSISCYYGESEKVGDVVAEFLSLEDADFYYECLRNRSVLFTDIPNWLSYYRTRELVVGTRIHGAILALQAGTPTVLITHDSRTKGLSDVLCVPSIEAEKFAERQYTNKELLEICAEQLVNFDQNRQELAARWKIFIEENGFKVSKHLNGICNNRSEEGI
ncbi:MAG: hypothetical protein ACI8Q1_002103 [Parvicella sp.]|jgi:hypothetical protein